MNQRSIKPPTTVVTPVSALTHLDTTRQVYRRKHEYGILSGANVDLPSSGLHLSDPPHDEITDFGIESMMSCEYNCMLLLGKLSTNLEVMGFTEINLLTRSTVPATLDIT